MHERQGLLLCSIDSDGIVSLTSAGAVQTDSIQHSMRVEYFIQVVYGLLLQVRTVLCLPVFLYDCVFLMAMQTLMQIH